MFKFGFQPEELNDEFRVDEHVQIGQQIDVQHDAETAVAPITPTASIPCLECEEIFITAAQRSQTLDTLKHGLILFAGGQHIYHVTSDVLLEDLVEEQIQQRLRVEREAREREAAAAAASGKSAAVVVAEAHATDLIPGVYEGKAHHQRRCLATSSVFPRSSKRPRFDCDRRHSSTTSHQRHHHHHRQQRTTTPPSKPPAHHRHQQSTAQRREHEHRSSRRHHHHHRRSPSPPPCNAIAKPPKRGRNEHRHPWFNAELAALIALREKAHRKWLANKRRRKDDANWEAFRRCRSAVSAVRRAVRDDYLAAALHVDRRAAPMPWQTKGIKSTSARTHQTHTETHTQRHGVFAGRARRSKHP